jgi:hypothetical protein
MLWRQDTGKRAITQLLHITLLNLLMGLLILNLLTVLLLINPRMVLVILKPKPLKLLKRQKLRSVNITLPLLQLMRLLLQPMRLLLQPMRLLLQLTLHPSNIDLFMQLLKPKLQRLRKPRPSVLQHTTRPQRHTDQPQPQFDQSTQLHLKLKLLRHRNIKLIVPLLIRPQGQLPILPRKLKLRNLKAILHQPIVHNRFTVLHQ